MAAQRWIVLPGGRPMRWKKSRADARPGILTTRFVRQVPPHWYRNTLNRRERRRARWAIICGDAHAGPHVHAHTAAWYW